MGWADEAIEWLREGNSVIINPKGNSMLPKIRSGDSCLILPITERVELKKGDIVLCKVNGRQYLHYIAAVRGSSKVSSTEYLISNARGRHNGWTHHSKIYGVFSKVLEI